MKNRMLLLRRALCVLLAAVLSAACIPGLGETAIHPWINSDVDGSVTLLTRTRLQDDFHLAVNRKWLLRTSVPYGGTEASSFGELSYALMERKIDLMQDQTLSGHDAELVRTLYDLTTDWDTRNALGAEPLRPYADRVLQGKTEADQP